MRVSRVRAVLMAALLAGCAASPSTESDPAAAPSIDDEVPDRARVGPQGRVAQFVVSCEVSHISSDDPIVLPDQPGVSHEHQFFGNVVTDDAADYERALDAGTSCDQRLDTASYWAPTMFDADGTRIDALGLTAYYRPGDGVDPRDVVAYPPGFMVIAGSSAADEPDGQDVIAWGCGSGARREDLPPACAENSTLRLWITFPDCWDESRLSSFGSGAHVRYSNRGCPPTHRTPVPQLQMAIDYPPVDPDGLRLSSGPISSAHADFWNTWDQDKLEREVELCINRDLVCGLSG
ncbi:MAG: DUF1996 domain-containing protein [Ilumatobacter sp.]